MGVYIAPEIKDRVAVGDDLYTITDSGGKKKLTPSPTEVSEPGTEINKALLQPMADALQEASENLVPYNDYWWRIKQNAGSYNLKIVPSKQITGAYVKSEASNGTIYYRVNILETWWRDNGDETYTEYNDPRTIQVASSLSLGSDGTISLVNPTSYSISGEDFYSYRHTFYSIISGKYVKGFSQNSNLIYKIGTLSDGYDIDDWNAKITSSGETTNYTDYYIDAGKVQVAVADYSATVSDFSYVSNEDENFYPHTGTQGGIEYQYLGKIFDVAVKAEPYNIKTINITSASWSDRTYSIDIPCSRYMLWVGDEAQGKKTNFGSWLLVDNQKIYGAVKNYNSSNYDYYTNFYTGFTPGTKTSDYIYITANIYMNFTDTGIKLLYGSSVSTTPTAVLAYLPL